MHANIDVKQIIKLAREAGSEIMSIYEKDFKIDFKEDDSPLTEADVKSNQVICDGLSTLYPDIPILSEENKVIDYEIRKTWDYFWLIDPIDGTKEFIKKNDEFTVNIALVHKNQPVLGVVYAPAIEAMYFGIVGEGAYLNDKKLPLQVNNTPEKQLKVVASKSHLSGETQAFIDALETEKIEQVSKGSSLKLCMVAEGSADIYPRLAPTMEWDTAAAHAVVLASGKGVYQYESGDEVIYNKENLLNPWFIVK